MSQFDDGRPEWPPAGGGTPAGPLGRAFADLAADAPPTELSAHDIMNAAHEQSHRRHRWVLATGVAAAAIAVTTLIGVSVSQSGSGSDTSGAAAGPASSSASSAAGGSQALVSTPSSQPDDDQAQPAPGDQSAGGGAAESPSAAPPAGQASEQCASLSPAEQATVTSALPGLAVGGCLPGATGLVAGTSFDGPGVSVIVTVQSGSDPCPADAPCAPIDGHPGIYLMGMPSIPAPVPGATPVRTDAVTVVGAGDGRIVSVQVLTDEPGDAQPYPVDDLATLVEQLLAG